MSAGRIAAMNPTFVVRSREQWPDRALNVFTLKEDRWDDYHFKTTFHLFRGRGDEDPENFGIVKIARFGMGSESGRTTLDRSFNTLGENFFSLGQDREYYDKILALDKPMRQAVLIALRDIAFDSDLYDRARSEFVTSSSLLRDVNDLVVKTQFRRITHGRAVLSHYEFTYDPPQESESTPPRLSFRVSADSTPPTNVHVLIGANGVGKSTLMRNFAASLSAGSDPLAVGSFGHEQLEDSVGRRVPFNNVVTVAFSAFDVFPTHLLDPTGERGDIAHAVVGLGDLEAQFAQNLRLCVRGPRRERWLAALRRLTDVDAVLRDERMEDVLNLPVMGEEVSGAGERLRSLSSGHKIVLLTITAIVRFVEERTLVLVDEPETHLHPPLLSAFIRALSELIGERNGVAIVATHSPVVLQDVPRSCVHVVRRRGRDISVSPPMIETFGESVSVLTSTVFGLDVTTTGFHSLLDRVTGAASSERDELHLQLGAEGRALLRALEDDEEDSS
ncbi:AAA family ATPase [Rathayibacter sp. VKM Ac-2803]|uniref:AAA family ATPase n=1 Tax=Rathayibacter sp. VKM Ac-2803 TaxID=2609256 RepID=UPI00135A15CF|nr:AAA family ATPase [Rathayibacter sp. VKM Ac-2803]